MPRAVSQLERRGATVVSPEAPSTIQPTNEFDNQSDIFLPESLERGELYRRRVGTTSLYGYADRQQAIDYQVELFERLVEGQEVTILGNDRVPGGVLVEPATISEDSQHGIVMYHVVLHPIVGGKLSSELVELDAYPSAIQVVDRPAAEREVMGLPS